MTGKPLLQGALLLTAIGGVAYLATTGCCRLMGWGHRPVSMTADLALSREQQEQVAVLEKDFLIRKSASCDLLCAKRAHLIQQLKQEQPDREVLTRLVDEIGAEQTALERVTVDHLLAVREKLDLPQRKKWTASLSEKLRTACKATACGSAGRCFLQGEKEKR